MSPNTQTVRAEALAKGYPDCSFKATVLCGEDVVSVYIRKTQRRVFLSTASDVLWFMKLVS